MSSLSPPLCRKLSVVPLSLALSSWLPLTPSPWEAQTWVSNGPFLCWRSEPHQQTESLTMSGIFSCTSDPRVGNLRCRGQAKAEHKLVHDPSGHIHSPCVANHAPQLVLADAFRVQVLQRDALEPRQGHCAHAFAPRRNPEAPRSGTRLGDAWAHLVHARGEAGAGIDVDEICVVGGVHAAPLQQLHRLQQPRHLRSGASAIAVPLGAALPQKLRARFLDLDGLRPREAILATLRANSDDVQPSVHLWKSMVLTVQHALVDLVHLFAVGLLHGNTCHIQALSE